MANQTITTAVNYDDSSISGLLNGESITINGGALTINSDVRWNQQAAVFANLTCSATLGGSVTIDGTQVWELPFSASTGNVPTQGNLGTNTVTGGTSGATGELLRVWSTGSLTPITTGGGAMPSSGFVKLRSKSGNFQSGEIVSLPGGATITISSAGQRSWIHIVGVETGGITPSKLSQSAIQGDWYYLGTTNGADDQTFQFPVADYCPAMQVETAVGSNVYEWWLNGADGVRWGTATQFIATDVRGKYFGSNATTGVITIAKRASNPCGYKPVSGLRVRIPNIICSSSNSSNYAVNTWNTTTIAQRYRGLLSSNNCDIYVDKICSNWYWATNGANNITVTNCALMPLVSNATPTGVVTFTDIGVGCSPAAFATNNPFVLSGALAGGTISKLRATCIVGASTSDATVTLSVCNGLIISDCQCEVFGGTGIVDKAFTVYPFSASRCGAQTITNLTVIGGAASFNTYLDAASCTGLVYADKLNGTTNSTIPQTPVSISTSPKFVFTGPITWFGNLSNVQPYTTLVAASSGCTGAIIQNIGTASNPLDFGNITGYFGTFGSSNGMILRRCYVQNSRLNILTSITNDCINFIIDNVGTDYADLVSFAGVNTKWRGIKATNTTTGQTATLGLEYADCFTSATTGRIIFCGNIPNETSGSDLVTSLGAGGGYSGAGAIIMPNVGDSATWTHSYYVLGHTGFSNVAPTLTAVNSTNFTIEFQYDTGSGFNGTWLAATGANLSGIGAINPSTGIKLKVRATVNTASASNALIYIRLDTTTTAAAQDTLYAFPYDGTGTITNLISGSRIQVYNQTKSTELVNQVVSGTSYSYSYYTASTISTGDILRIRVSKLGYLPQTLLAVASSTSFSATANQQLDTIYNSNAIDGSAVTEFTTDYPNIQIDISDPDGTTSVKRIYAWLRYIETTQNGIAQWLGGVSADDEANYSVDQSIVNLKLDNTSATPVMIIDGRLYRKDGSTVIASTSNSIQMDPSRVYPTDTLINVVQASYDLMKVTMALSA